MFYFESRSKAREFASRTGRKVLDKKDAPSINGHRWAVASIKN